MAQIDVSDLLTDPDFVDNVSVTRLFVTVDSHGRTQTTAAALPIVGSVQAGDGIARRLLDDGVRVEGAISIHTRTRLTVETPQTEADVLVWNGNTYVVSHVTPWSNWGVGFYRAVCTLKDVTLAPVTLQSNLTQESYTGPQLESGAGAEANVQAPAHVTLPQTLGQQTGAPINNEATSEPQVNVTL